MKTILTTSRLILSELNEDDAEFIFELVNEPAFLEHIGDKQVRTLEDARQYIHNGPAASYRDNGFGLYKVTEKISAEPVGVCGLVKRDSLELPDIGYAILQRYWRKGFAFEAAAAVLEYEARQQGISEVFGVTSPANGPSQKLLEKLGLHFYRMFPLHDDTEEVMLYRSATRVSTQSH